MPNISCSLPIFVKYNAFLIIIKFLFSLSIFFILITLSNNIKIFSGLFSNSFSKIKYKDKGE